MNKYIVLNGKRYVTLAKWTPTFMKPMTVRQTLLGETDATYGPSVAKGWAGEIKAPVIAAPSAEYGTITDLMAAIETMSTVAFVDHYGAAFTVHLTGEGVMRSLHNMWDASSNAFYVPVILMRHVEVA